MTLRVREYGEGAAVLLIGGCPMPASHLEPLARALAERHRVLLPDLPGYGESPRLSPYSLAGAQRLLEDELLARGIRECALIGFSLGAWRGLAMAISARVRPTAVVAIGGVARWTAEEKQTLAGFAQMLRANVPSLPDLLPQRMLSTLWLTAHPESAGEVRAWLSAAPPEVIADELESVAREGTDLRPQIARLRCPILSRVGEWDVVAPAERAREVGGTLEVAPGCGHALLLEDFPRTLESIRRVLG